MAITVINTFYSCIDNAGLTTFHKSVTNMNEDLASIYRMAGAFYIVKNSGDISYNTPTSLSAMCFFFHVTATVTCPRLRLIFQILQQTIAQEIKGVFT